MLSSRPICTKAIGSRLFPPPIFKDYDPIIVKDPTKLKKNQVPKEVGLVDLVGFI